MNNRLVKLGIILFSTVFTIRVVTIFTADRCYSMSMAAEKGKITPDRAIRLLNIASTLDLTNVALYSKKFDILRLKAKNLKLTTDYELRTTNYELLKQQLHLMKRCINLCPSWPAYHLYYALILSQMSPRSNIMTRKLILSELKKATELKPYSLLYNKIYNEYSARLFPNSPQS